MHYEGVLRGWASPTLITAPSSQGKSVRLNVRFSISLNSAGVSSEASNPFRPAVRKRGRGG